MSKQTLVGGPLDGQEREVYAELKVPMSDVEYGWKHACGHRAVIAAGKYDREGRWQEPKREVLLDGDCSQCDEFGRFAVSMFAEKGF